MNILADSTNELINIIILVVVAILFALAKFAEKMMRKASERQAEEEKLRSQDAARKDAEPEEPRPKPARVHPSIPSAERADRKRGPDREPAGPIPVQPPPLPQAPPRPMRRPQRRPQPVSLEPVRKRQQRTSAKHIPSHAVEEEIRRLQSRLGKLEDLRRHRLSARVPPEAIAAEMKRGNAFPIGDGPTEPVPKRAAPIVNVNLASTDMARMAIVYHEIFSMPKALRTENEMWDM